ncbi:MAG: hypothetical protein ACP5I8_17025, partial [Phycisphaerae bacterium]
MQPNPETFITTTRREFIGAIAAAAAVAGLDEMAAAKPSQTSGPDIAAGDPPEPEFHGPRVIGGTPGKPFLFRVPFTGKGSIALSVDNLPAELRMSDDGIISGRVPHTGEYRLLFQAVNAHGKARRVIRLIAGQNKLGLTPQMGWNAFNALSGENSAALTRANADALLSSGLAAKGYMYVNIDGGWQDKRNRAGEMQPKAKFGDLKDLSDYLHRLGFRFGIYSCPGVLSCGRN